MTEALNSDREIEKIILAKGAEGSIKKIEGKAKAKKIPLYYSDKSRMDRDADGGNHQGVIAVVSDYEYATVEEILNVAKQRGEDPFVILLDGLEEVISERTGINTMTAENPASVVALGTGEYVEIMADFERR